MSTLTKKYGAPDWSYTLAQAEKLAYKEIYSLYTSFSNGRVHIEIVRDEFMDGEDTPGKLWVSYWHPEYGKRWSKANNPKNASSDY